MGSEGKAGCQLLGLRWVGRWAVEAVSPSLPLTSQPTFLSLGSAKS